MSALQEYFDITLSVSQKVGIMGMNTALPNAMA